jgi:hypothetical protein
MFGTYRVDTRLPQKPNRRGAIYSDRGDDSTRPSEPSGWDGWYEARPTEARRSVATAATRAHPVGSSTTTGALALTQQPALEVAADLEPIPGAPGPAGAGAAGGALAGAGPGWGGPWLGRALADVAGPPDGVGGRA